MRPLCVDSIIIDDLHCRFTDCVHSLRPKHLLLHFELFGDTVLFSNVLYQPREHFFRLLVQISKVVVELAACQQFGVNGLVVLFQILQMPLSPYPDGALLRLWQRLFTVSASVQAAI